MKVIVGDRTKFGTVVAESVSNGQKIFIVEASAGEFRIIPANWVEK